MSDSLFKNELESIEMNETYYNIVYSIGIFTILGVFTVNCIPLLLSLPFQEYFLVAHIYYKAQGLLI